MKSCNRPTIDLVQCAEEVLFSSHDYSTHTLEEEEEEEEEEEVRRK